MPKKPPVLELAPGDGAAESAGTTHPKDSDKPPALAKRIAWAQLLKRVFDIDISVCSRCQGKVKIIAAIEFLRYRRASP